MGWPDRLFRALMRLLPAEFRGDYEREMAATFRAERHSADGAVSLTRVWLATIADVFRTAPAEHLDILQRDLAYTFRMLARRPVLTFTAILTLALGVGANTAIFSVVNGVVFAISGSAPRAVLYALDGTSGKELWNSGATIATSIPPTGGVSTGNSQIYVAAADGNVYTFGFPMEH